MFKTLLLIYRKHRSDKPRIHDKDHPRVKVQLRAASINPSDVRNVDRKIEGTTLPRTPGRDFSGVVTEGPASLVGVGSLGTGAT